MQVEYFGGRVVDMRLTIDINQDAAARTSTLKITKVELKTKTGSQYMNRYITGTITLNGHPAARMTIGERGGCAVNITGQYSGGGDGTWPVEFWQSVALTVPHWATGECSVSLAADVSVASAMGDHLGEIRETVTADLPKIDQVAAAQIRVGAVTLGQQAQVTLEGTDSRTAYDITWASGSQSGTIATGGTADRYNVTLPESLRAGSRDGQTVAVTFRCITKASGKQVGQSTAAVNAAVPVASLGELTAADTMTGDEMLIRIAGADSRLKYTVQLIAGGTTDTIATDSGAREFRYRIPENVASRFPNAERIRATVRAVSSAGTIEAQAWVTAGASANPEIGTVTMEDVSDLHAVLSNLIQGKSKLHINAQGVTKFGATVKTAAITLEYSNGQQVTVNGLDATITPGEAGAIAVRVELVDSRGRGAIYRQQQGIFVRQYRKPAVTAAQAYRCKASGAADDQGGYAAIRFSASAVSTTALPWEDQSIRYVAEAKAYGASQVEQTDLPDYDGSLSVSNGVAIVRLSQDGSYTGRIVAEDLYGDGASVWVSIPAKYALMDFDRENRAVGIGQKAQKAGTLGIGMTVDMAGNLLENAQTDRLTIKERRGNQPYAFLGIGVSSGTNVRWNVPTGTRMIEGQYTVNASGNLRAVQANGTYKTARLSSIYVLGVFDTYITLGADLETNLDNNVVCFIQTNNDTTANIEITVRGGRSIDDYQIEV